MDEGLADSFLRCCTSGLSGVDRSVLVGEVSLSELLGVGRSFLSERVPGSDRLPVGFYITFWDLLGEVFLEVMRSCFRKCVLPAFQYDGIVRLLPKPGDLRFLANWRPIFLLNVDYKIVLKLLAGHCRDVLGSVVSVEQFCGIPGRSLLHWNSLFRDLNVYISEFRLLAAMISLD